VGLLTTPEPGPLIVVPNDADGNRTTGVYLAEALVRAGHVVVQVEHPGFNRGFLQKNGKRIRRNLQKVAQDSANWAHRPLEVPVVLARVVGRAPGEARRGDSTPIASRFAVTPEARSRPWRSRA
jgi:predicted dienelactone hydrolase